MPARVKNRVAANVEAIAAHVRKTDAAHPATQQEWRVTGVPGLSLVRTPGGTWSWHLRFMAGAGARRKSVRRAIGHAHGPAAMTLAAAKAEAIKVANAGPQGYGDDAVSRQTLRELFDAFKKFSLAASNPKRRSPLTMRDYGYSLERFVFDQLGKVPVNEIQARDVAKVLAAVEAKSPKAAHNCRAALGAMYKWAAKRLLVDENIMVGMGFSYQTEPRNRVATDDEIRRIWTAIESEAFDATPAMRLILKIGILTGQRNKEIAGAGRSELRIDANIANPHWHIPAARMKRRKGRDQYVFLSDQARALFGEALALAGPGELVFPGPRGEPTLQTSVSHAWARARKLAGVKSLRLHDMRKTIATWAGDRGERSDVLDRMLHHAVGHHSNQRGSVTESHYNFSIMAGPLRDAWQRWADHVERVAASASGVVKANVHALPARA